MIKLSKLEFLAKTNGKKRRGSRRQNPAASKPGGIRRFRKLRRRERSAHGHGTRNSRAALAEVKLANEAKSIPRTSARRAAVWTNQAGSLG